LNFYGHYPLQKLKIIIIIKNCPDLPIIRCFTLGIEPENPLQSGNGITTEAAGLLVEFVYYKLLRNKGIFFHLKEEMIRSMYKNPKKEGYYDLRVSVVRNNNNARKKRHFR